MIFNSITRDHHAFLLSLDGQWGSEIVATELEGNLASTFDNELLTFHRFIDETFTIKLARGVKAAQENKNRSDERRILLVSFTSITREAQNALLKVLEEPTERTHLFLITPHLEILLPTVRSRCQNLRIEHNAGNDDSEPFLSKSLNDRLAVTSELLETKSKIAAFFSNLEREISQTQRKAVSQADHIKILDYKRKALSGTPAVKYLLEELALTLPRL